MPVHSGSDQGLRGAHGRAGSNRPFGLSVTELAVLRDAADGLTIDETAERRGKSAQTVKSQRSTVILKLNARNIAHAVAIGIREHLIEPGAPEDDAHR
jgi:DNA-binding CsgD family transcriptional regulator